MSFFYPRFVVAVTSDIALVALNAASVGSNCVEALDGGIKLTCAAMSL